MNNTTPVFNDLLRRCAVAVNTRPKKDSLTQLMLEVQEFVLDTPDDMPTNNANINVRGQRQLMMCQFRDLSNQYNLRFVK